MLEPLSVSAPGEDGERYLQTSPEFAMKRLLAAGSGPIYQICKAFRAGEYGRRHNPEFTMLEWYRPGFTLDALMDEVAELVAETCGIAGSARYSYAGLFRECTGVDPLEDGPSALAAAVADRVPVAPLPEDPELCLDLLLTHCVEPALVGRGACFVYNFPPQQAALACLGQDEAGRTIARRFELYIDGVELANGFQELRDPGEQRRRFEADLKRRAELSLPYREPDARLLGALEAGLPECAGVALGLDRLLMVASGASSLHEVLAFGWHES